MNKRIKYSSHTKGVRLNSIAFLCVIGFSISILTFFPGWMSNDSAVQYAEAKIDAYGDWHPPLMAYWWHFLIKVYDGPALMLIQNLLCYWISFYLITKAVFTKVGKFSLVLPLLGIFPGIFFPLGQIWKDIACATSLLLCWALIVNARAYLRHLDIQEKLVLLLLCIYAVGVKPNAIVVIPFLILSLPNCEYKTIQKSIFNALIAFSVSVLIFLVATNIVPSKKITSTYPFQYTQIYDLLGISVRTDKNRLPSYIINKMGEEANNLSKYYWVGSNNALYYNAPFKVGSKDEEDIAELKGVWVQSIKDNMMPYLVHRMEHFLSLLRWKESSSAAVASPMIVPNNFGILYSGNSFSKMLEASLRYMPQIYFPWIYLVLSFCALLLAVVFRHLKLIYALPVLSTYIFTAPHFFIAPANDYRYLFYSTLVNSICVAIAIIYIAEAFYSKWQAQISLKNRQGI